METQSKIIIVRSGSKAVIQRNCPKSPLPGVFCCKTMTTPMVAQLMNRDRYTGKLFLLGMASGRIIVAENWSEISFTTVSGS